MLFVKKISKFSKVSFSRSQPILALKPRQALSLDHRITECYEGLYLLNKIEKDQEKPTVNTRSYQLHQYMNAIHLKIA